MYKVSYIDHKRQCIMEQNMTRRDAAILVSFLFLMFPVCLLAVLASIFCEKITPSLLKCQCTRTNCYSFLFQSSSLHPTIHPA